MQLLKYYSQEEDWIQLSIHHLLIDFMESGGKNAADFISFGSSSMTLVACEKACQTTKQQCDSKIWNELQYARITASRLYEVARCKTSPGSLIETITGGLQIKETEAMKRGKTLEKKVLNVLAAQVSSTFEHVGLLLSPKHPLFGASPDAISKDFVVEIKCPSTTKTVTIYIKDGVISNKCKAQIQLQMLMF